MKSILAILMTSCLLTACVPIQSADFQGGVHKDHFSHTGSYGLLSLGDANKPKEVIILVSGSYAISPDGKRYDIKVKDHYYDLDEKHAYIRDQVRVYDSNGRLKRRLSSGKWVFVFRVRTSYGVVERRFTGNVNNWIYSPFIHGAPN